MLARDSLLPWKTALGNAMFGMEVRGIPNAQAEERAGAMLQEVGLAGFENTLPKALSHGMRQRVALARTFSLGSALLMMDEPFGALDAQTKLQLEDLLLRLCSIRELQKDPHFHELYAQLWWHLESGWSKHEG